MMDYGGKRRLNVYCTLTHVSHLNVCIMILCLLTVYKMLVPGSFSKVRVVSIVGTRGQGGVYCNP